MAKKKGPKMAHPNPAQEELARELEGIASDAAVEVDEQEFARREEEANKVIEDVRARASRRERA
jgi:hypothetical protein